MIVKQIVYTIITALAKGFSVMNRSLLTSDDVDKMLDHAEVHFPFTFNYQLALVALTKGFSVMNCSLLTSDDVDKMLDHAEVHFISTFNYQLALVTSDLTCDDVPKEKKLAALSGRERRTTVQQSQPYSLCL